LCVGYSPAGSTVFVCDSPQQLISFRRLARSAADAIVACPGLLTPPPPGQHSRTHARGAFGASDKLPLRAAGNADCRTTSAGCRATPPTDTTFPRGIACMNACNFAARPQTYIDGERLPLPSTTTPTCSPSRRTLAAFSALCAGTGRADILVSYQPVGGQAAVGKAMKGLGAGPQTTKKKKKKRSASRGARDVLDRTRARPFSRHPHSALLISCLHSINHAFSVPRLQRLAAMCGNKRIATTRALKTTAVTAIALLGSRGRQAWRDATTRRGTRACGISAAEHGAWRLDVAGLLPVPHLLSVPLLLHCYTAVYKSSHCPNTHCTPPATLASLGVHVLVPPAPTPTLHTGRSAALTCPLNSAT